MNRALWRIVVPAVAFLVILGCSANKEKETPAYFSARTTPPLKVPPDLDEPYRAQSMQLPEAAFQQHPTDTDVEKLLKPPRIVDDSGS